MLDTNIVSAEFRTATPVGNKLSTLSSERWCISAITWSELCFGLALHPEATRLAQLLQTFGRIARIFPWDAKAAEQHAHIRAAQRQK
ncbi:MAG: PIN domain-containing protein [Lautropia sp.]|nr:PIN domain-containing protein [Lautropia sp.]